MPVNHSSLLSVNRLTYKQLILPCLNSFHNLKKFQLLQDQADISIFDIEGQEAKETGWPEQMCTCKKTCIWFFTLKEFFSWDKKLSGIKSLRSEYVTLPYS